MDNYSNIENAEEDVLRFQQETSIIRSLDHKHIVKMYDIFEDHEHYYVVMELVSGGELFDQIVQKGFYPEDEAVLLIHQVLTALVYLESLKICHRDLKPENLIFTDDTHKTLKLIDFGEAKSCANGPIKEYVGTTDYMAPEIIKGGEYDTRVDMWSLGVIAYVMLCGFPPWEGENESEVFVNIMTLQYDFPSPEWDIISDTAKDFIRSLLVEHGERLTAKEAKAHPWMKTNVTPAVQFSLTLPANLYSSDLLEKLKGTIGDHLKLNSTEVEIETETVKGVTKSTLSFPST
uniref:non-specific serine/threonine protein kinase n=1 Tax=Arcella intermedia TaxID=1963864 RepID=A0A6B2L9T8_9EUKA